MEAGFFSNSLQHIAAELSRIDLLVRALVRKSRELQQKDSEFQGLYISEQEVDRLMDQGVGMPAWAAIAHDESQQAFHEAVNHIADTNQALKNESLRRGVKLRLEELSTNFRLTPFEVDILLICLAPEFDLRYEKLYAYLQDDVTKKRPSVDLVLNLLSPSFEAKVAARNYFTNSSNLLAYQLLHFFEDPAQQPPPLLGKYLKIDDRIVTYLHGSDEIDSNVRTYVKLADADISFSDLILPHELKHRLSRLAYQGRNSEKTTIFYFQGPYGVGKRSTAGAISRLLELKVLIFNLEDLVNADVADFDKTVNLVQREAILQNAALFWNGFDALLADDKRILLNLFLRKLENHPTLTFLAGQDTWEPADALQNYMFCRIKLPLPSYDDRLQLWTIFLDGNAPSGNELDVQALAGKFRFSGGQIRDAAATAFNLATRRNPGDPRIGMNDLYAASRLQSNRKLATLAQKIKSNFHWDDIVLPRDRIQQLREICNQVKYRSLVYDKWGFNQKLSLGKGLNVLFSGPSGTGKTMAAEIMGNELNVDLYKIDLSSVISKYIGETEKNLARIFAEADTSNAILFFDEADALFGKRSEIRDSHDRYANIEISYLLQKMEEYQGVVILATNFRKNMDQAFVRRMHFSVEFPFPSEKDRLRIWEQIWPEDTPCSPALDLRFVARQFEITGGNIRNIALASAFLAATDNENMVQMTHIMHATKREYQKMGKVVSDKDFEGYSSRMSGPS